MPQFTDIAKRRGRHGGAVPRSPRLIASLLSLALLLTGCSWLTGESADSGPADPAASDPGSDAQIRPVTPQEWQQMKRAGMVRPECPIQDPERLRVVEVNHHDFRGKISRGRLMVNADVASSVARIFGGLYDQQFPIRRMMPVEQFDGDTNASLRADNTSAFNCRRPDQINAPFGDSPHANGRAVDINPRENPWMDLRCDCWLPTGKFRARVERPGAINRGGVVWKSFHKEGWIWQNIDVPDYMHFDTGYPSRPFGKRAAGPLRRDTSL